MATDSDPNNVSNRNGGANLNAEGDVNIEGDVIGRDKIVNIKTRMVWIGVGLIAIAIAFVVGSVIFNVGPLVALLPTPTPSPTPLAFGPATEGQSLIIVADFEDRSGGKYQGIDPAQYIYEQLTAQAKKDNLGVRIERLRHTVDDNTVRPTGETYSATLVLWGWYDAFTITPRVERIRIRSDYQSTEEGVHLSLADPTKVEFSIVTDLPSQSTYLVLFVLGLDAYFAPRRSVDEALPYFSGAIESLPTNMTVMANPNEAHFFRGNVYIAQSNYDRAIGDYDKAIQFKPDLAAAYFNRGVAYVGKGDYDRAIADFDQAIQFKLNDAAAYFDRGLAYDGKGDYDRAIADFDQAIQLKPDLADAYVYRGITYELRGENDKAIADFKKVFELSNDPNLRQKAQDHLKALGASRPLGCRPVRFSKPHRSAGGCSANDLRSATSSCQNVKVQARRRDVLPC